MHSLYGFREVVLDQYNSASTIQRLNSKLKIRELTWTVPSKTEAYSRLRELFNAGNIELYPHPKVISQLKNLIVQYRTNGTWNVTGGSGAGVDDYCSVLAAVALATLTKSIQYSPGGFTVIPRKETALPIRRFGHR
jgi:hypothetical protein